MMNAVKIQYFRRLNPKRRIEKNANLIYDHPKFITYTGFIIWTLNMEKMNEDH
jgi:hypothetical protein